ncbi:MAG: hypothetical protein AB2693_23395, partial [Candidatus Thiodiazotropha sp.]
PGYTPTVTSSTQYYAYKSYIQTLLKYGSSAKDSQLSTQIWIKDRAGHLDDNDIKTGENFSSYQRSVYFSESKLVHLIGPINHDACKLDRFIPNGIAIGVKFYRSKPQFCLMTDSIAPNYAIHIDEMILHVCNVKVNPAVI